MNDKKEYIEREAVINAILGQPPEPHYPEWYYRDVKDIPAADVVEVVHARWIDCKYGNVICGWCGFRRRAPKSDDDDRFYCAHCGAKMDGGNRNGNA